MSETEPATAATNRQRADCPWRPESHPPACAYCEHWQGPEPTATAAPPAAWRINDAERAVLDAVHDTLCACRQPSGLGMVIPQGGEAAALLAQSLTAQIERAGFRVVQADA